MSRNVISSHSTDRTSHTNIPRSILECGTKRAERVGPFERRPAASPPRYQRFL